MNVTRRSYRMISWGSDIPRSLMVDLAKVDVGSRVLRSAIPIPPDCQFLEPADETVVSIRWTRKVRKDQRDKEEAGASAASTTAAATPAASEKKA